MPSRNNLIDARTKRKKRKSLKISVPLDIYWNAKVQNVLELKTKIAGFGLPTGWNQQYHPISTLAFTTVVSQSVILCVVGETMEMEISVDGEKCEISGIGKVDSVKLVVAALNQITQKCNICPGVLVDDFMDILSSEIGNEFTVVMKRGKYN